MRCGCSTTVVTCGTVRNLALLLTLFLAAPAHAAVERVMPKVVGWRRDLHQHPELSNRETRTAGVVAEHLRSLGMEVRTGVAHTGVVGILRGGRPGPTIAVRADMDALPVTEDNTLPWKSTVRAEYLGNQVGVMHACGHDVHTAVQMGVASVLAGMRQEIPGTVVFVFQPAEEGAPPGERGGAAVAVPGERGAFDGQRVHQAEDVGAEVAREQSLRQQEADQAKIEAKKLVDAQQIEADRAVQEAKIAQMQALELARQEQQIAVQNKSREESQAKAKADEARAEAVVAEERVGTAREAEVAATIAVVLGTLCAVALVRFRRFRGKTVLQATVSAPLVMPDVITGLSLLLLFVAMESMLGWPQGRGPGRPRPRSRERAGLRPADARRRRAAAPISSWRAIAGGSRRPCSTGSWTSSSISRSSRK